MATIGSVLISVYAKTDGLRKSLKKAQASIGSFAKKAAKTMAGIGTAIGAAFGATTAIIVSTVNKYAAEIDKLAKTSAKIGTTVGALQKLQYQAELTGVSSNTLNMALQRMVRRVAEAAQGTGEAKNALKELGISAKELNRLSPDQQFYRVSEAMKSISNQGDKVRLAMKLFDSEGVSLVNTMNGNLEQMGAEFDKLGISITQSGAQMVEAYNDSKAKMSAIFSGFGLKLTEQLAQPFTKLVEFINKTIMEMGGMEAAANKFARFMVSSIQVSVSAVAQLINAFRDAKIFMKEMALEMAEISGAFNRVLHTVSGGKFGKMSYKIENELKLEIQKAEKNRGTQLQIEKDINSLLEGLKSSVGANPIDLSDVIKPEHHKAFQKAANDAQIRATADAKAAEKTQNFASAIERATQAVNPESKQTKSSHFSKAGGLNPGFSGVSIAGRGGSSAQNVVNSQSAKNVVNKNNASIGQFDINMTTDTGKISGKLFGEPSFISNLKAFSEKQTNQEARAVTV